MNFTHAYKSLDEKKLSDSKATSVLDTSFQSKSLQRKADMANNAVQRAESPRPNNTEMPDNLKAGIESLSGFSMDDVRVHYNSSKPATVQALAYTQGTDIHVAPGQEKHLPHEAWHVAQQKAGRVSPTTNINGKPVNDSVTLENEADVMGNKALETSSNTQQLKKEPSFSSHAIQCLKTLLLNPQSNSQYEIGFIMFSSNHNIEERERQERNEIANNNPAFEGIIGAGHTMLHGLSPNSMFSYGFWTDNMNPEMAHDFNEQMNKDENRTNGVVGEYRNDTHLSIIMQSEETRVVIRVSEDTFNLWQSFVTSSLDNGCIRYTFHPGVPYLEETGYSNGLDNCVSFAFSQMIRFLQETNIPEQDTQAIAEMVKYIIMYQEYMKKRLEDESKTKKKKIKSGLQGGLMHFTRDFITKTGATVLNSPRFDDRLSRQAPIYKHSSHYRDSIYQDVLENYARIDSGKYEVDQVEELALNRVLSLPLHQYNFAIDYDSHLFRLYYDMYVSMFHYYKQLHDLQKFYVILEMLSKQQF